MFAGECCALKMLYLLLCFREFVMTSEKKTSFTFLEGINSNRLAYSVRTAGILTKDGNNILLHNNCM